MQKDETTLGCKDVPQHIRHNEESHMTPPDINLVQMRHATITSGHGDILHLYVHVVLGCSRVSACFFSCSMEGGIE